MIRTSTHKIPQVEEKLNSIINSIHANKEINLVEKCLSEHLKDPNAYYKVITVGNKIDVIARIFSSPLMELINRLISSVNYEHGLNLKLRGGIKVRMSNYFRFETIELEKFIAVEKELLKLKNVERKFFMEKLRELKINEKIIIKAEDFIITLHKHYKYVFIYYKINCGGKDLYVCISIPV